MPSACSAATPCVRAGVQCVCVSAARQRRSHAARIAPQYSTQSSRVASSSAVRRPQTSFHPAATATTSSMPTSSSAWGKRRGRGRWTPPGRRRPSPMARAMRSPS
ncbi:uncharacterized protein Tco025E_07491, partial [Trypanosoma conorhini]